MFVNAYIMQGFYIAESAYVCVCRLFAKIYALLCYAEHSAYI